MHAFWLHFFPHQHNDHRPHALAHHHLAFAGVTLVTLKLLALALIVIWPTRHVASQAITKSSILALTNEHRQSTYLAPLKEDARLTEAATQKAKDMIQRGYFSHVDPEGNYLWSRYDVVRYPYKIAGENLAAHYTQAEDVTGGWMVSPAHRENILEPRYTDIGIGIAEGIFESKPSIVVVQAFGATKSSTIGPLHFFPGRSIVHAASVQDLFGSPLSLKGLGTSAQGIISLLIITITAMVTLSTLAYAALRKKHHGHLTLVHALGIIGTGIVVLLW